MPHAISRARERSPSGDWLARAAQALEDTHLACWSANLGLRERFGLEMAWYLQRMPQTQTCVLSGGLIHDLEGFCRALDRALPASTPVARTIDGPGGVIDRLRRRPRERPILGDADIIKHRYYVWRDADMLLRADPDLFGRLADAITGVAAEAEFASEDRLLIHRCVFVGGPSLDAYARDPAGQFQSWFSEHGEEPFWSALSGLPRPNVRALPIEAT
ncbi:MAG: hypothetical protein JNK35_02390 [Phycisphaerae bacterium]|nr:hypothetical protein [Phycisphaerae bacterium]